MPKRQWPRKKRTTPRERIVLRLVLGIAVIVALWMYADFRLKVRAAADRNALGAIRCSLNFAFVHHQLNHASKDLVVSVRDIPRTMDPPILPNGITIRGEQLQDRRGNRYDLIPESASMPARILLSQGGFAVPHETPK